MYYLFPRIFLPGLHHPVCSENVQGRVPRDHSSENSHKETNRKQKSFFIGQAFYSTPKRKTIPPNSLDSIKRTFILFLFCFSVFLVPPEKRCATHFRIQAPSGRGRPLGTSVRSASKRQRGPGAAAGPGEGAAAAGAAGDECGGLSGVGLVGCELGGGGEGWEECELGRGEVGGGGGGVRLGFVAGL